MAGCRLGWLVCCGAVAIAVGGCGAPGSSSKDRGQTTGSQNADADDGVFFVGFDASPPLIEALRAEKIQGLVLQNPYRMGGQGVHTLIDHLEGQDVEPVISTGETLATPENMDDPEVAELLNPPKIDHSADARLDDQSDRKWRIMVIPKGTTHEFWQTIHAGAKNAADERNAAILWKGPQKEDDRQQQIALVQNAISLGVDGIVLAPLDAKALVGPVEQAVNQGIPVVIIDSALDSEAPVSTVATDNYNGGVLAAQRLGALMTEAGKTNAILMRYAVGSASTEEREQGFLDTMQSDFPEINIIEKDQYAGATAATALQASQRLMTRYRNRVEGIFAPNESSTFGMLRALDGAGLLRSDP